MLHRRGLDQLETEMMAFSREWDRRSTEKLQTVCGGVLQGRPKIFRAGDLEPPVDCDDQRSSRRRSKRIAVVSCQSPPRGVGMPSQAAQFFDLYLEAPVDISRVLWLATAGGLRYLNPP